MGYIQGEGRDQGTLFPVVLDDFVPADHVCRVIDAFVEMLVMSELGFERAQAAETGRRIASLAMVGRKIGHLKCSTLGISVPTELPNQITPEVAALCIAAESALARNFSILVVEPQSKKPFARYSPAAVNSATKNPAVALRPYHDGVPANYCVACGQSDITVVDVDHGIPSRDQLDSWMQAHNLPPTFTVQSGRDGEAGFHLYYQHASRTTGFELDGVTGELKGHGGDVVGADVAASIPSA